MKIITGDVTKIKGGIIGHQVNCKGVMGAGVAKALYSKYPEIKGNFLKVSNRGSLNLGLCQVVECEQDVIVCNLFGQDTYGRTGVHTIYMALKIAIDGMLELAKGYNLKPYLPYGIGCGLAGGDWEIVSNIIKHLEEKHNTEITLVKLR